MSFNLLRNSRVFFTTAVPTSGAQIGIVGGTGAPTIDNTNTREIQVLDGFGFSQNTTSETVTLNETGAVPVRGQRTFNTQLDPVDFNMTTYIRPFKDTTGGVVTGISQVGTTGITAGSGGSTALLTAAPADPVAASAATQAYAGSFGLNTFVYATTAPTGGITATFAPIFGVDPAVTATYQKLIGIRIVNGGSGYTIAPTITIVDPDSGAEAATPSFTATVSAIGSTNITAEESVLWNALFTGSGNADAWSEGSSYGSANPATTSQAHQLKRFGLIIVMDTSCFVIDDCVLNTATVDFGIDAIASVQWAGQAKAIRSIDPPLSIGSGTFSYSGTNTTSLALFNSTTFKQKTTAASFIANKLSTITLTKNLGSTTGTAPTVSANNPAYNVPLTGGNLTISNNISYLTPANLGVVNQPATYFAGTRAISGSLTAYLRSGTGDGSSTATGTIKQTSQLLKDLLSDASTAVSPAFYAKITVGAATGDHVDLEMPGVVLTIPTIATEQVISTTINFTAQGTDSGKFDLEESNELNIKYYAV